MTVKVPQQRQRAYQAQLRKVDALAISDANDRDLPSAFQELLKQAPSRADGVEVQLRMAFQLALAPDQENKRRAAALYQQIFLDQHVQPIQRVYAILGRLQLSEIIHDATLTQGLLSCANRLASSGDVRKRATTVNDAVQQLLEVADQLYPTALVKFQLASWYGERLMEGSVSTAEREASLRALQQNTQQGEALIPEALKYAVRWETVNLFWWDGRVRRLCAALTGETYEAAERAFERALYLMVLEPSDTLPAYDALVRVRLSFAAMLAEAYGVNRQQDIVHLLEPVCEVLIKSAGEPLLFNEWLRHPNDLLAADLTRLSALDPDFANALHRQQDATATRVKSQP